MSFDMMAIDGISGLPKCFPPAPFVLSELVCQRSAMSFVSPSCQVDRLAFSFVSGS